MRDRNSIFWRFDQGAPDAVADVWTKTGSTSPTLGVAGLRINVTSAETLTYRHGVHPGDRVSRRRHEDWIEVQAEVTVSTQTPGWSSGAPCVGVVVADGARELALVVGNSLAFVNPSTGDVVLEIQAEFAASRLRVVRLRKEAATRWVAEIDDVVVGQVPYDAAPEVTLDAPNVRWGNLDASGTSDATWGEFETALNGSVAPPWRRRQVRNLLPTSVGSRWTVEAEALARGIASMAESAARELHGVQRMFSAGREAETTWTANGDVLPSALSPAWTVNGSAKVSVLRGRLRVANLPTQAAVSFVAPFSGAVPATAERYVEARITIRSFVEDAQGRCGPYLVVDDGTKRIHAWAVWTADYQIAWVLGDNAGSGSLNAKGTRYRIPHPGYGRIGMTTHRVQLIVLGTTWVLLVVDGVVAHRAAYSDFSTVASSAEGAAVGCIAITNTFDVEDVRAGRRLTDLGTRRGFLLRLRERLVHVGGAERNDELDVWLRTRPAMHAARGRTNAIVQEIRRLTQSQDSDVVAETSPADWYLETTWPDVTPIYLEATGQLRDVFAELVGGAPNFTRARLAEVVAWYLLPRSVTELEYWACHAVLVDGSSTVPASGTTRIPVADVAGFAVGDVVHVRNSANTTRETSTITAVGADYLEVVETSGTWASGDRVRLPIVRA